MAYVLIIAGLISLVSGIFLLTKEEEQVKSNIQHQKELSGTNITISSTPGKAIDSVYPDLDSANEIFVIKEVKQDLQTAEDKASDPDKVFDPTIENKKKGDAFEKYVVKRFDREFFRIKEWRSDKYVDGIYADSNRHPDLEISFKNRYGEDDLFAVECKWKKDSFKGQLEWAAVYQLNQYQKFSKRRNLPVFIIIGVGGSPADPKYVYVIPLQDLKSHILDNADIKQYLKTDERGFYWDKNEKTLN